MVDAKGENSNTLDLLPNLLSVYKEIFAALNQVGVKDVQIDEPCLATDLSSDAINAYARSRAVYGQVIQGRWYDTGNPADYLIAQFAFALSHPGYGPALRALANSVDGALPGGASPAI